MQRELVSFLAKLVLLTTLVAVVFIILRNQISAHYFYHGYAGLLAFFFFITLILHLGYERSFKKGSKYFIRFYMLASGLKLFGFLTILFVFGFLDRENMTAFAVTFLLLYFVYTAFELAISYKKVGAGANTPV